MDKATKISKESEDLLEQVVERYEAKIAELQDELKKYKTDSKKILQKSGDLQSLSQELKQKTSKAYHSYQTLEQLLNATKIPILFLDEALRIQYYTPEVEKVFGKADFDTGKLLSDVIRPFSFKKLNKKIETLLQNPEKDELKFYLHELQRWYITRILPFATKDDKTNGVLLTFLNISEDKKYEKKLNRLNQTLELEIKKRKQQVKDLASDLIVAEQNERKRIARLLHNDLQQILFAIQTKAKLLKEDTPDEFAPQLSELINQLDRSLKLTHQLVLSLRPPNTKTNNLHKGLNWLCEYIYNLHGLMVKVECPRHIDLENRDVLILLLQIIQEFLFNIVKYAGVDEARLITEEKEEEILIQIIDDGTGFDENEINDDISYGLYQAKEHIELIGGHLDVDSTPGKGTTISLSIPKKDYIKTVQ